jgi:hypothetical protein
MVASAVAGVELLPPEVHAYKSTVTCTRELDLRLTAWTKVSAPWPFAGALATDLSAP